MTSSYNPVKQSEPYDGLTSGFREVKAIREKAKETYNVYQDRVAMTYDRSMRLEILMREILFTSRKPVKAKKVPPKFVPNWEEPFITMEIYGSGYLL